MRGYVFAAALFCASTAYAQPTRDASYFCVAEASGGLNYNTAKKKWEGVPFRTNEKFILKLKFKQSRMEKLSTGKEEAVSDFEVTYTEQGKNRSRDCHSQNGKLVAIRSGHFGFECSSINLTRYKFDLETNRYLAVYLYGFIDAADNNEDTPSVTGGTCTKID